MRRIFFLPLLLFMITISLEAQKNTDLLSIQSDSCKTIFQNVGTDIKMPSYTFEDYLNGRRQFKLRSRNGHQPLLVIDGIISNIDSLDLVSLGDIKSLTVLKNGSATRLYGNKARDGGVIIITTRRNAK